LVGRQFAATLKKVLSKLGVRNRTQAVSEGCASILFRKELRSLLGQVNSPSRAINVHDGLRESLGHFAFGRL
jgi:hypothetical protein